MNEELAEKVKDSIERLKAFEPKEGYHLAFSGGKDYITLKRLADLAGVKYHAVYRVTGIDPPELVQFIKQHHPDVEFEIPRYKDGRRITMWNLIEKKLMPPTRLVRYCCQQLKESAGDGMKTLTGVRWAESTNRKNNQGIATIYKGAKIQETEDFKRTKQGGLVLVNDNDESRMVVENCYKRGKVTINPIIDWTDDDVWNFIHEYNVPYCSLYDEGFKRIGCIGCPMARRSGREKEFQRWPKYKDLYIMAFQKMLEAREKKGKMDGSWRMGTTPQDVYNWWMEYDVLPGQTSLFEEGDEDA